jgi:DNA-binding transcriptional MerR regulator
VQVAQPAQGIALYKSSLSRPAREALLELPTACFAKENDRMALSQPTRRDTQKTKTDVSTVSIPDKLYFRIGEVARLSALPTYVLRFWESEFPQLKPNKGGTGQRLYRKRDVEVVMEIKRLLYDQKFTISGARRILAEKRRSSVDLQGELPLHSSQPKLLANHLQQLRGDVREILGILDGTLPKHSGQRSSSKRTARPSSREATPANRAVSETSAPLLF